MQCHGAKGFKTEVLLYIFIVVDKSIEKLVMTLISVSDICQKEKFHFFFFISADNTLVAKTKPALLKLKI